MVLLFKKGDTNKLKNYRPIALLNNVYKIYAALIQKRMAKMLGPVLQCEQFGLRRCESTSDAIHCIRRAMEYGEHAWNRDILLLLD